MAIDENFIIENVFGLWAAGSQQTIKLKCLPQAQVTRHKSKMAVRQLERCGTAANVVTRPGFALGAPRWAKSCGVLDLGAKCFELSNLSAWWRIYCRTDETIDAYGLNCVSLWLKASQKFQIHKWECSALHRYHIFWGFKGSC